MSERDGANVRVPPPLLGVLGIAAGAGLDYLVPLTIWPYSVLRVAVGAFVVASGLALIVVTALKIKRSGQNPEPWQPTPSILTDGPFARSRNPVYVGMLVIQIGAALALGTAWILVMVGITWLALRQLVVIREEDYLEQKFGEEYLSYKRRVRRWV